MLSIKVEERLPDVGAEITKTLVVEISATYPQLVSIRKSVWELVCKSHMDPHIRDMLTKMVEFFPHE